MPRDQLRIGRFSEPNRIYFVTINLLVRKQAYFSDFTLGRLVVHEMQIIHDSEWADSIAWVLMPDHLHWLFQLGQKKTLSEVVKAFKARSAKHVNTDLNRTGSIWQRAFYDHALRKDEDIKGIARYIVANPLRAGLVNNIADYPFWDATWL